MTKMFNSFRDNYPQSANAGDGGPSREILFDRMTFIGNAIWERLNEIEAKVVDMALASPGQLAAMQHEAMGPDYAPEPRVGKVDAASP